MKVKFSKLAKRDYDIAFEYYKKESNYLSKRFKNDIKESIQRILLFPNLYPNVYEKVQKCVVTKFPFTIYYSVKGSAIYIIAIANHYKNPDVYIKRLK